MGYSMCFQLVMGVPNSCSFLMEHPINDVAWSVVAGCSIEAMQPKKHVVLAGLKPTRAGYPTWSSICQTKISYGCSFQIGMTWEKNIFTTHDWEWWTYHLFMVKLGRVFMALFYHHCNIFNCGISHSWSYGLYHVRPHFEGPLNHSPYIDLIYGRFLSFKDPGSFPLIYIYICIYIIYIIVSIYLYLIFG